MKTYLVGMFYHDQQDNDLWEAGVIEEYESSTGIFITAGSEQEAISWGEQIASKLFKITNPNEGKSWNSFGHNCWIENIENSNWKHCFDFFQNVKFGEMPDFSNMGSSAYKK